MRIGILGAGDMADALGTQWIRAGHEVMISGRDLARASRQAERMNAQAGLGGNRETAQAPGVGVPRGKGAVGGVSSGGAAGIGAAGGGMIGVGVSSIGVPGIGAAGVGAAGVGAAGGGMAGVGVSSGGVSSGEVPGGEAPGGGVGDGRAVDEQMGGGRGDWSGWGEPGSSDLVRGSVAWGGAWAGSWEQAAEFGEVVMVGVREAGLIEVLRAAGTSLCGKPLIDVTNAAVPDKYDPTRPLARRISDLTGGHVVKAFNLCHVDVWRMTPPVFGGRPLAVPLCGDDAGALELVRRLVGDLGCTPLDGGGLDRAVQLEATAAFMIGLWFGGADAQAILPPLESSGAHLPSAAATS